MPQNIKLRETLASKSLKELTTILSTYKTLHNSTDVDTTQRAIRAIEIAAHTKQHPQPERTFPKLRSITIGIDVDRETRRTRISARLKKRLKEGMVEEIKGLLNSGLSPDQLIYYGLEYKYVTLYVIGKLSFDDMQRQLEIAIHQFAKRQMTWFRGMEKRGTTIKWVEMPTRLQGLTSYLKSKDIEL